MPQRLSSQLRSAAVRAARSAAVLGLEDVAVAVGASRDQVVSSLMEAARGDVALRSSLRGCPRAGTASSACSATPRAARL